MPEKIEFEEFVNGVDDQYKSAITEINDYLIDQNCVFSAQRAKSGIVVTYSDGTSKKALVNYVFRKKGMLARIYGNHVNQYEDFLKTLPESMKKEYAKSPACKRMLDSSKCNSRCPMGFDFEVDGERYQKCRYNAFMFLINDESIEHIRQFISKELAERTA